MASNSNELSNDDLLGNEEQDAAAEAQKRSDAAKKAAETKKKNAETKAKAEAEAKAKAEAEAKAKAEAEAKAKAEAEDKAKGKAESERVKAEKARIKAAGHEGFIAPIGERHLYHVQLENPLYDKQTGKKLSKPYIRAYTEPDMRLLRKGTGLEMVILWDPTIYNQQ